MRGTNYWGNSKITGVTSRAFVPGGPGEQTCDQPPGHQADLRALPPAPSRGLFGPLSLAFSVEQSGGFQGVEWDHRAAPGARPAAPQPPPAPGAGAPSLRLQKALPSLSSRLHIRAQAYGGGHRQHRRRWKLRPGGVSPRETQKTQEVPRRARSAQPTRRGPTPRTRPWGKPSTPLPDASPLFFLNYGFKGIINQRLVSYDYDTV